MVSLNTSLNNTPYDMKDDSPGCGTDKWVRNNFKAANESCIHQERGSAGAVSEGHE